MADCSQCGGTGWKGILRDGIHSVVACDCRRSKAGFQSAGEVFSGLAVLEKLLTPKDRDIAGIIARRRGAAQAISIDEITRELLAQRCSGPDLSGSNFEELMARSIKDSVRRRDGDHPPFGCRPRSPLERSSPGRQGGIHREDSGELKAEG